MLVCSIFLPCMPDNDKGAVLVDAEAFRNVG
jgi:hypothetical protein